mmetsp:Transcript_10085/g.11484  ORF Transcript_10085/g.11484 Transcript_10085/m.11484 type:complete len:165 (+) Transcript_10085:266-760(+)
MGRRPGRPAKCGRKRKSETKDQNSSEEVDPMTSKASREEKKIKYYNDLIRKQEEREQKKKQRKERKKIRQDNRNLIMDTSNENIPLVQGTDPMSQRSYFVNKKEEINVSIELVEDSTQLINPHLYNPFFFPDTTESSYVNKNGEVKDISKVKDLVNSSMDLQKD